MRSPVWILALFATVTGAITVWYIVSGSEPDERVKSAFADAVTLFIGIAFYATAIMMTTDSGELNFTLRWLLIGLAVSAVVAVTQGIFLMFSPAGADYLHDLTGLVAIDQGAAGRAQGLALEPSWFASQMTLLGIPIILLRILDPSVARGWQLHVAGRSLLVQPIWFVFALFVAALVLSFSRAGLLVFVASLLIVGTLRLATRMSAKNVLVAVVVLPVIVAVILVGALSNSYVRAAFDSAGDVITGTKTVAESVGSAGGAGRLAFAAASWNTFLASPITGVGLGQSPFYFYDNVPSWTLGEPEVARYADGEASGLPNAKNMFLRVLAETGIIGAAVLAFFVIRHLVYALGSRRLEVTAFALVVAVAMAVDFMSLDSFALPTFWWALAIMWALARLKRERPSAPLTIQRNVVVNSSERTPA